MAFTAGAMLATEAALFAGAAAGYLASKPKEPPVDLTKPVEADESAPPAYPDAYAHMAMAPGSLTERFAAPLSSREQAEAAAPGAFSAAPAPPPQQLQAPLSSSSFGPRAAAAGPPAPALR